MQLDSRVDRGHWTLDSIVMFVFVSSLYLSFLGSGIVGRRLVGVRVDKG